MKQIRFKKYTMNIKKCLDCPLCKIATGFERYCSITGNTVDILQPIPKWCPLEDYVETGEAQP